MVLLQIALGVFGSEQVGTAQFHGAEKSLCGVPFLPSKYL